MTTAGFEYAAFESISAVGSLELGLESALAGDATRSRLADNIATPATVSAGRWANLNILFMHQTFGSSPRFLVVETNQTASQNVHTRVGTP